MQSFPAAPLAPSRRDLLAGLGLAAAPLVLGAAPRPAHLDRPSPPVQGSRTVLLRRASLVLTMDPAIGSGPLGAVENADVLMRAGAIAAVGTALPTPPGAWVVEASGKLVMPGFVDTHNHLWQSMIRGGCTDRDLFGWFQGCTDPQRGRLSPEALHSFVRLAALDAVQSGVTTLVDWVDIFSYDLVESYVRALAGTGVRFTYAMFPPAPDGALAAKVKRSSSTRCRSAPSRSPPTRRGPPKPTTAPTGRPPRSWGSCSTPMSWNAPSSVPTTPSGSSPTSVRWGPGS